MRLSHLLSTLFPYTTLFRSPLLGRGPERAPLRRGGTRGDTPHDGDLRRRHAQHQHGGGGVEVPPGDRRRHGARLPLALVLVAGERVVGGERDGGGARLLARRQIGRASCRERGGVAVV